MKLYNCPSAQSSSINLNFRNSSIGLFFAFVKNGNIIKDPKFLKSAHLWAYNKEIVQISDGNESYGKSCQFKDDDISVASNIYFDHVKPILFPLEVWALLYTKIDNPMALFQTCKYLYKLSRHSIILQFLKSRFNMVPGWYSLPFTNEKIGSYVCPDTLNLSKIDCLTLKLEFNYEPIDVLLIIANRYFNVVRVQAGMMGLAYVN